jgi:phospholipid/cholesterol/gamma-HCH transport system ATP-binding protein
MPDQPQLSDSWLIEAEHIAAGYTNTLILNDISLKIHTGKITCIIGGSGCGKSTFLRTAIGMLSPRKGFIKLFGQDVYALEDEARAELVSRVGFMFQYGALLNSLTVEQNLLIPLRAHTDLPEPVLLDMVRMKLELVHLSHAWGKLPGELSGGMRKRVGLARGIMLDPDLVFCDEPSAGLDPITMAALDELILQLKALLGMTFVVVTHELDSIRKIADRVIMLVKGYVHFDGTLEEALTIQDPTMRSFFDRKSDAAVHSGCSVFESLTGQSDADNPLIAVADKHKPAHAPPPPKATKESHP